MNKNKLNRFNDDKLLKKAYNANLRKDKVYNLNKLVRLRNNILLRKELLENQNVLRRKL